MSALNMISFMKKVQNTYCTLCTPVCTKYDLNTTCLDILLFLANNPQYSTAKDIQNVRGIKSGIASVAVETLIQKGYLTRSAATADRRIKKLAVTDLAAPVVADGRKVHAHFARLLGQGISEEEWGQFRKLLEKVEQNLCRVSACRDELSSAL